MSRLSTRLPDQFTKLYIDEVSCEQIYRVTFSYIDLAGKAGQISDGECIILVRNDELKRKILENISQVILCEESWDIVNVASDDIYIYLTLRGDANKFNEYLGNKNVVQVKE